MAVVIDLNLVCIVCLQDDGGELKSVFSDALPVTTAPQSDASMTIAERITFCSELNLSDINIKISNKICDRCLDDLAATWRFRKNCETANSLYRSIQQEEEDVVSLANYELESQKTKEPAGLKIRRVHPEVKSYLSTSQIDEEQSDGIINETDGEKSQDELDSFSGFSIVEYIDEDDQKDTASTDYFDYVREERLEEANDNLKDIGKQNVLEVSYAKSPKANETTITRPKIEFEDHENSQLQIKRELSEDSVDEVSTDSLSTLPENNAFSKHQKELISTIFESECLRGRVRQNLNEKENSNKIQSNTKLNFNVQGIAAKRKYNPNKVTAPAEKIPQGGLKSPSHKSKPFHSSMKICEICGNIYKYQHALSAHMRRHNNDRQFGCELCDKAFVSNVELRRHMRVHTGHKPYPCSFCDRRFSDFGSRSKHERTHTGERPYHCTTCKKSFAYPHVLTVHLRTHTGEKKFQCTRCGRGFTKKAYLLAHLENHTRCENISLMGRLSDEGSLVNSKPDAHITHQQEITAIKTVAVEECIFTTELITEGEENISNEIQHIVEQAEIGHCAMELEEAIDEEHLDEENDVEYILGVQS
ncbi:zinc finger protein 184 [Anastrepha obliqua]|uniref:zinc finger protein 184 n=1 Tax=Anastrepha obliqua TaxID=95512 RepID=UPI002409C603|nr:zinc finger protein 184 [Anastrepha obliqua]